MSIRGAVYTGTGDAVQGSVYPKAYISLTVSDIAVSTPELKTDVVVVSSTAYVVLAINKPAVVTEGIIVPPGITYWGIERGQFLSFIKLNGAQDSQLTVIVPR